MLFDIDETELKPTVSNSLSSQPLVDADVPNYTLAEVRRLMDELTTDPLKNSGGRVVHPTGDGSSGIMLIGEAPGAEEDRLGEPFVGASGRFLNTALLPTVDLTRQNIYLTNIVKCRPPENRDPTDVEKTAWTPILVAEIAALRPRLIVCLGRHSLGFFDPKAKISKAHGQVFQIQVFRNYTQAVFASYHPAVALYNGSMRETLVQDFQKIKKFII